MPVLLAVSWLEGQTKIDLRGQSKTVDFTAASFTKPVKTGVNLPSTCATGEAFLKSNADAGRGLYWCTATNTWTQQTPNAVDYTQPTTFSGGARQTFQPSSTTAGLRLLPALLPSGGLAGDLAVDATDSYKLKVFDGYQWSASSGASGGDTVIPGVGITVSGASPKQVSVDTAVVPTFLTGTAILDFPAIEAASCQEMSLPLVGAAIGDAVAAGWPPLSSGLIGMAQVTTVNEVSLRLCNLSAIEVDPPNTTYRATIVRGF
ncbi:MAG: hypothetical protein ACE141_13370 [Bryobacteraceae bacterium]